MGGENVAAIGLKPKKFFVVKGSGLSKTSKLNAFDAALKRAGIAHCNLVPVSSILPRDIEETQPVDIEPGTIIFVIIARQDGESGEKISAGLAWAKTEDYGLVVEGHDNRGVDLRNQLRDKVREMAEIRKLSIKQVKYYVEELEIPPGLYGSCIVALVLLL